MLVRILFLQDLEEAVPISHSLQLYRLPALLEFHDLFPLFIHHKVKLIGERPPDVTIGCQARDHLAKVIVIVLRSHYREPPAIVGMEENEVGFDSDIAQLGQTLFQVPEELRIESGEIELPARILFEREKNRFVSVIDIMLGEDTHSQLVERRSL